MAEEERNALRSKYLLFALKGQTYAIDIDHVIEIVRAVEVTALPAQPEYLVGVADLRGLVIPIMDVCLWMGKGAIRNTDRTCIIVVNIDDTHVGLLVENVCSVLDIFDDDIKPPPDLFTCEISKRFLTGIAQTVNSLALVVNCDAMVSDVAAFDLTEIAPFDAEGSHVERSAVR